MPILNIYKPKGLTPLETINLLREKLPEYKDKIIGFAGRLDPLAHGVLLLMVGEETTKEKDKYLHLPKEYEFEAVFGVSTDTYDVLGIINNLTMKQLNNDTQKLKNGIDGFIKSKLGRQTQLYPPYSSKTVYGKPLYQWAREGKLSEIQIPQRDIEIYDFKLIETNNISASKLKNEITKQINLVHGDFRQKIIKEKWDNFFANKQVANADFQTARFIIRCSSGTYIRTLINELGHVLNLEALALEIRRTEVGDYNVKHSLTLT